MFLSLIGSAFCSHVQPASTLDRKISLTALKRLVLHDLPPDSPVRDDILSQPDDVSPDEFLSDCAVWLRLLKLRVNPPQHGSPVG